MKTTGDDLESALCILGGKAKLKEIYFLTGMIQLQSGKHITRHFQELCRYTLQRDSHNRFKSVNGKGVWSLRHGRQTSR